MSPRPPPRGPTLPTPRIVMYCPVATPAGTFTRISCSCLTRPSPRHFLHGDVMIVPSPAHVGHGATLMTWPKNDFCARRTSPAPAHVVQRLALVPGSAPLPSQRSQLMRSFTVTVFSTPVSTSASLSGIVMRMSEPVRGPVCPPARPPNRALRL